MFYYNNLWKQYHKNGSKTISQKWLSTKSVYLNIKYSFSITRHESILSVLEFVAVNIQSSDN